MSPFVTGGVACGNRVCTTNLPFFGTTARILCKHAGVFFRVVAFSCGGGREQAPGESSIRICKSRFGKVIDSNCICVQLGARFFCGGKAGHDHQIQRRYHKRRSHFQKGLDFGSNFPLGIFLLGWVKPRHQTNHDCFFERC